MFKQVKLNDGTLIPYYINEDGILTNSHHVILKPYIINSGYEAINLKKVPNNRGHVLIHRLVAMTFIGHIPKKYVVNHIDGIKTHNCLSNLEIIPFTENVRDAVKMGLTPSCENHRLSTHTNRQANQVCSFLAYGMFSIGEIAKSLDVKKKFVKDILYRRKWKNVSKHYVFDIANIPKDNRVFNDREIAEILKYMAEGKTNKEILILMDRDYKKHNIVSAISKIRVDKFND